MQNPQPLPSASADLTDNLLAQLREAAPQIFDEGKVDFTKLKAALGEHVTEGKERYGLTWSGKGEAFRNVQSLSAGTLAPQLEESVNWDASGNLIIEGDNLEVLKLLQRPYHGAVKVIYIDPPYNTGQEFIYPDNFHEGLADYLRYSGQVNEEGLTQSSNKETNGRYHSNWLNMMYPRLFLARNLLRDDGVIFVSIDDHEVHNLRHLMNEIFGEENFEGHIHWRRRHNQPNDESKMLALVAEHILVFARDKARFKAAGVGKIALTGDFSNPDNDPRGDWASKPWKAGSDQSGSRYPITSPTGNVFDEEWMGERTTFNSLLQDKRIVFPKGGKGFPRKKYFRFERESEGQCATNWWTHESFGHNQSANSDIEALMGVANVFSNPKPKELINGCLEVSNAKGSDIILDFFAGSGTTAQAVLELNAKDGGNRKFILVQLPEKTQNSKFPTIVDITRERVRRVIAKLQAEETSKAVLARDVTRQAGLLSSETFEGLAKSADSGVNVQSSQTATERKEAFVAVGAFDLGFRAFKLAASNFRAWDPQGATTCEAMAEQLALHADHLDASAGELSIVFELMLRAGLPPSSPMTVITLAVGGAAHKAFAVNCNELIICVEPEVSLNVIHALLDQKPKKLVCLDKAFVGDDAAKTNAVLLAKERGVTFYTA
jgi:adenine-specific DNA-methyltransferase